MNYYRSVTIALAISGIYASRSLASLSAGTDSSSSDRLRLMAAAFNSVRQNSPAAEAHKALQQEIQQRLLQLPSEERTEEALSKQAAQAIDTTLNKHTTKELLNIATVSNLKSDSLTLTHVRIALADRFINNYDCNISCALETLPAIEKLTYISHILHQAGIAELLEKYKLSHHIGSVTTFSELHSLILLTQQMAKKEAVSIAQIASHAGNHAYFELLKKFIIAHNAALIAATKDAAAVAEDLGWCTLL